MVVSFFGGLIPTYIFVAIGSQAAQSQDALLVIYIGAAPAVCRLYRLPRSRFTAGESVSERQLIVF